ncbi:MAG: Hint domain-containing protein [Albidovulum sp.]|uniref:Hint domain-containing protein n=1 Tax=Albidovulum sp. TaxID=1872424 RepID=UPI003CAA2F3A
MDQTVPFQDGGIGAVASRTGGAYRREDRVATPLVWTVPGFVGTARVSTAFGDLPIKVIRQHDPLRTVQGPVAKVAKVSAIHLDEDFLSANRDAMPVRIPAGMFGPGRPAVDILVSPQQRINVSPGQFRQDFRLARDLEGRPGVMRVPQMTVSYYSIECTTPAAVLVEGLCISTGV